MQFVRRIEDDAFGGGRSEVKRELEVPARIAWQGLELDAAVSSASKFQVDRVIFVKAETSTFIKYFL